MFYQSHNASKLAYFELKKIWGGATALPQTPAPVGRRHHLPTPHPLGGVGAFGALILARLRRSISVP